MKNITSDYKTNVKNFGRQIDSKISYTIEGTTTELGKEQLNSVTPHYESQILKSTMKQLDIDSNVDIPLNTTLNYQFGVLVNNDYEYINYGNYVVYSSEKQEDTNSYKIVCYDKMLYSMVDYTKMNITYPITIRNYIQAICDTIGLNFKNANDEFANYDKEIQNELYFDADGKSLGYKFRDVLDELAQVTGSTICISEDDELEIRYTNDLINESKEVEGNPITIQDNEGDTPLEIDLKGNTTQNGTPTPSSPVSVNNVTGRQEIDIVGKNLADIEETKIGKSWANADYSQRATILWIPVKTNTNYTLVSTWTNQNITNIRAVFNHGASDTTNYNIPSSYPYNNIQWEYVSIEIIANTTFTSEMLNGVKIMLCIGEATIDDYEPYIGKQYEINLGKNLIDYSKIVKGRLDNGIIGYANDTTNLSYTDTSISFTTIANWRGVTSDFIKVKQNTSYIYSADKNLSSTTYQIEIDNYDKNKEYLYRATLTRLNNIAKYTTNNNVEYVRIYFTLPNAGTYTINNIQFEEGSQATSYSPYKTPIELCKIGNYQDYIYKNNNKWYLHKEIGKVVLDGSEDGWFKGSDSSSNYYIHNNIIQSTSNYADGLSNYFINAKVYPNARKGLFAIRDSGTSLMFNSNETTLENWKIWLGTNNTQVYYPLANPTATIINDTELINQLERIKLLNGLNQISLSSDGTLKLSYVSDYEYIDENYLKDINVNFGEKYGPVNSIVLSRSAGADNVYLRDEDSIAEDGLCEIKISDNQIMNFNDRDTYLPDLLKTLKGYGYYINDYSSTGITFYELCDKYRVKIGDIKYPCIMYNDEVLVTQGLQENVHTDRPEESETDYSKADKTDRRINQTNLIVNKQTGQIEALTTKTEDIEEDLSENYYTKTMTNQLIQNAETGVTNTFSEAGGNNILRNTNFAAKEVLETGQEYEYWYGSIVKTTNNNSANGMSILLQNGNLYQEQQVANGTYTVSFYYKKLNPLATGKLVVNGIEYALTEDDYTLFQTGLKDEVGAYITQPIIVNDNYLKVQFTSDTNNAFEIYDIMCNFGTVKLAYSQNQNETITNTVNISKGITITASDKDVKFVATPDGIRIKNKDTDEIITDFTDKGMDTKNAIIEETATIVGIYRQKVGDQVWDSLM